MDRKQGIIVYRYLQKLDALPIQRVKAMKLFLVCGAARWYYSFRRAQELKKALQLMDVRLMDHIIVADGDYVSFAQSGYL